MENNQTGSVIDDEGFRANVCIVISNNRRQVFWGKRVGMDAWQFPQGGIRPAETAEAAMYRELHEETGLCAADVEVIGCTRDWLRYHLPKRFIRRHNRPVCIGQKQVWYLLRLVSEDAAVRLDRGPQPEFDHWRWIDFEEPPHQVVDFKQLVYRQALDELAPLLFPLAGAVSGQPVPAPTR